MKTKHPSVQQMRDVMHRQPPPYYFLTLDEITLRAVALGKITATLVASRRASRGSRGAGDWDRTAGKEEKCVEHFARVARVPGVGHGDLPREGNKLFVNGRELRQMHDPMTVAFEIPRPWPRLTREGVERKLYGRFYWPTLITIWHVDPERGGDDDSCGWSFPLATDAFKSDVRFWSGCEERDPWLLRDHAMRGPLSVVDAEAKLRYVFRAVAERLHIAISEDAIAQHASRLIHNPIDNIRSSFCFVPGYHSNFPESDTEGRAEAAAGIYYCAARVLMRPPRPWYRHPRWHVWHWKLQIHPVQQFKRWAFSRCAKCQKRFAYGESPVSHQWDNDGPRWFRSERSVFHQQCSGSGPARTSERTHDALAR